MPGLPGQFAMGITGAVDVEDGFENHPIGRSGQGIVWGNSGRNRTKVLGYLFILIARLKPIRQYAAGA